MVLLVLLYYHCEGSGILLSSRRNTVVIPTAKISTFEAVLLIDTGPLRLHTACNMRRKSGLCVHKLHLTCSDLQQILAEQSQRFVPTPSSPRHVRLVICVSSVTRLEFVTSDS